jgi:lipoprotein-anchoring transpeptidase ErfK/SrfK
MRRNAMNCVTLIGFFLLLMFASPSSMAATSRSISNESPGTIIVRTGQRRLYLVVSEGHTISYPVGVGRAGKQWSGTSYIASKHLKPAWSPPEEIRHDRPSLPNVIPSGSPRNPMGAAALVLAHGQYAIHGTNAPSSIGGFVSYGCIRMYNKDILDLYSRVGVGTRVVVQ